VRCVYCREADPGGILRLLALERTSDVHDVARLQSALARPAGVRPSFSLSSMRLSACRKRARG